MEYNTYLSDDEVDIEKNEFVELDQYGMSIEESDEDEQLEIRRVISNNILLRNNLGEELFYENDESTKKKSFRESKSPNKKSMSLNDLNSFIDKKLEEKKPKKFISKRSTEKKISDPSLSVKIEKQLKRHFNPKLVPYLFSEEYKNKKFYDDLEIPSFNNLNFPSL